jgi:EAL domain-containing protein (putative c-di-GMP-specific phosphodiesterase class I)
MELQTAFVFAFATADVLIELGDAFRIRFAAGACRLVLGIPDPALPGMDFRDLIVPHDRSLLEGILLTVRPGERFQNRTMLLQKPDGVMVPVTMSGFRLNEDPPFTCITIRLRDNATVEEMNLMRDDATGLLLPEVFTKEVITQTQKLAHGDSRLTLLELDGLDETLKSGGEEAQTLLRRIGGVLRAYAVEDMAGYFEDGRFGLFHEDSVSEEKLRAQIALLSPEGDTPISVRTTSFSPHDARLNKEDTGRVMRFVLQRFAQGNPDVFSWSSASEMINGMVNTTVAQMGELRSMLHQKNVTLQYQPIVSLYTEEVHHYEALTRFINKHTGDTIKFAEDTGIIYDVDLFVCREALARMAAQDPDQRKPIALNMSAHSLDSDVFIGSFRGLMATHPNLRKYILVELTETVEIRDMQRAAAILDQLKEDGHRICIDDFGMGATSFQYLRAFNIDFLKIDGYYINDLGKDDKIDAIIKSLIDIGHRSHIGVIAECIETQQQATGLLALGCEFGQGYYFAPPLDGLDYVPRPRGTPLRPKHPAQ